MVKHLTGYQPNALLLMAKCPEPGHVKTRLCPPLSYEQAAALYEAFLCDTIALIRQVREAQHVIAYLPAEKQAYIAELAPDLDLFLQEGDGLGNRLDHCLTHYLEHGYQRVVVISSDTPTLPAAYLEAAFEKLAQGAEVVIGPCEDGGYYLIGLTRPAPRLLREVRMSTPTVTADTLALAKEENLRVALLPTWYDVDQAADLVRLQEDLREGPAEAAPHTRQQLQGIIIPQLSP